MYRTWIEQVCHVLGLLFGDTAGRRASTQLGVPGQRLHLGSCAHLCASIRGLLTLHSQFLAQQPHGLKRKINTMELFLRNE